MSIFFFNVIVFLALDIEALSENYTVLDASLVSIIIFTIQAIVFVLAFRVVKTDPTDPTLAMERNMRENG